MPSKESQHSSVPTQEPSHVLGEGLPGGLVLGTRSVEAYNLKTDEDVIQELNEGMSRQAIDETIDNTGNYVAAKVGIGAINLVVTNDPMHLGQEVPQEVLHHKDAPKHLKRAAAIAGAIVGGAAVFTGGYFLIKHTVEQARMHDREAAKRLNPDPTEIEN